MVVGRLETLTSSSPVPAGSRDPFFARPQRKYPKKWPWLRRHHWRKKMELKAHSQRSWNGASAGAPLATRGDLPPVKEDLFNTVAAGKATPTSGFSKAFHSTTSCCPFRKRSNGHPKPSTCTRETAARNQRHDRSTPLSWNLPPVATTLPPAGESHFLLTFCWLEQKVRRRAGARPRDPEVKD